MPNGDDRDWVRFCAALEGFYVRHGHWPTQVRIVPGYLDVFRGYFFSEESWRKLIGKVRIALAPDAPFVAEDGEGRVYNYGKEGFPSRTPSPTAEQWLGIELDGTIHAPPESGPEEQRLSELVELDAVRSLSIVVGWVSYSHVSPIRRVFDFARTSKGTLAGDGALSLRSADPRRVRVALTAEAEAAFFEHLRLVRLRPGQYEPYLEHADDYPFIEITIQPGALDAGPHRGSAVVLFSESQGEFHAPWGIFVGGQTYWTPSDAPGRALKIIDRFLKPRVLSKMIAEAQAQG